MEFRKIVTITLYTREQKRHWCVEQSFGLCGRGRGWDDLGEWHWNMHNIIYETSCQSRFDARYWMLGAGALGRPRGMVQGGRKKEGSGWGTCVYLWQIHVDIWQNQFNIVKLKNTIKLKKKKKRPWWKIEGRRGRGQHRMRWLNGITNSMEMSLSKFWGDGEGQGSLVCCSPWGSKESDTTEWLNIKKRMQLEQKLSHLILYFNELPLA